MKTIDLLHQLITLIQKKPETVMELNWNEVTECILEEWSNCNLLYDAGQYQKLHMKLTSLCKSLSESVNEFSCKKVMLFLEEIILCLSFIPNPEVTEKKIYQANFDHECLRHVKNHTTVILGDSHVNFFSGNEMLTFLPIGTDFNICPQILDLNYSVIHMGPCLAYTSDSESSTFEFQKKLQILENSFLEPNANIVVSLGEIDLRVHVWKQVKLQNKSYTEIVDDILSHYENMLLSLNNKSYHVSVWGPIASQTDNSPVDPRFPRCGSEQERNMATQYFNDRLAFFCKKNGIGFYTIFYNMITEDFHTLDRYLSPDHFHLGQKAWEILTDNIY